MRERLAQDIESTQDELERREVERRRLEKEILKAQAKLALKQKKLEYISKPPQGLFAGSQPNPLEFVLGALSSIGRSREEEERDKNNLVYVYDEEGDLAKTQKKNPTQKRKGKDLVYVYDEGEERSRKQQKIDRPSKQKKIVRPRNQRKDKNLVYVYDEEEEQKRKQNKSRLNTLTTTGLAASGAAALSVFFSSLGRETSPAAFSSISAALPKETEKSFVVKNNQDRILAAKTPEAKAEVKAAPSDAKVSKVPTAPATELSGGSPTSVNQNQGELMALETLVSLTAAPMDLQFFEAPVRTSVGDSSAVVSDKQNGQKTSDVAGPAREAVAAAKIPEKVALETKASTDTKVKQEVKTEAVGEKTATKPAGSSEAKGENVAKNTEAEVKVGEKPAQTKVASVAKPPSDVKAGAPVAPKVAAVAENPVAKVVEKTPVPEIKILSQVPKVEEKKPAPDIKAASPAPPKVEEKKAAPDIRVASPAPPKIEEKKPAPDIKAASPAPPKVEEKKPAPDIKAASPVPPKVEEKKPAPDIKAASPAPPKVEEKMPAPDMTAASPAPPKVEEKKPAPDTKAASPAPPKVEEKNPAPDIRVASPAPPKVEEKKPATDIKAASPAPPKVEEKMPSTDIKAASPAPPKVEEQKPAPDIKAASPALPKVEEKKPGPDIKAASPVPPKVVDEKPAPDIKTANPAPPKVEEKKPAPDIKASSPALPKVEEKPAPDIKAASPPPPNVEEKKTSPDVKSVGQTPKVEKTPEVAPLSAATESKVAPVPAKSIPKLTEDSIFTTPFSSSKSILDRAAPNQITERKEFSKGSGGDTAESMDLSVVGPVGVATAASIGAGSLFIPRDEKKKVSRTAATSQTLGKSAAGPELDIGKWVGDLVNKQDSAQPSRKRGTANQASEKKSFGSEWDIGKWVGGFFGGSEKDRSSNDGVTQGTTMPRSLTAKPSAAKAKNTRSGGDTQGQLISSASASKPAPPETKGAPSPPASTGDFMSFGIPGAGTSSPKSSFAPSSKWGDSKSNRGGQGEAISYLERMSGGSTAPASSSTPSAPSSVPDSTFSGRSSSVSAPKPSPTEKNEPPATSGDFMSFGMPGASTSSPKSSFAPSSKWGASKSNKGGQGEATSYLERMSGGSTAPASSSTPSATASTPDSTFSGRSSSVSAPKPSPTEKNEPPATSGDFMSFGMPGAGTSSPKSSFSPSSTWGASKSDRGGQGEANSYLERMSGGNAASSSSSTPSAPSSVPDSTFSGRSSSVSAPKPSPTEKNEPPASSGDFMSFGMPGASTSSPKSSFAPSSKWGDSKSDSGAQGEANSYLERMSGGNAASATSSTPSTSSIAPVSTVSGRSSSVSAPKPSPTEKNEPPATSGDFMSSGVTGTSTSSPKSSFTPSSTWGASKSDSGAQGEAKSYLERMSGANAASASSSTPSATSSTNSERSSSVTAPKASPTEKNEPPATSGDFMSFGMPGASTSSPKSSFAPSSTWGASKSDSGAQGEANSYLERMSGGNAASASSSTPSATSSAPDSTFSGRSSSVSAPKPSPTEKNQPPATSGDFMSFGMPGASTSSPKSSFAPSSKWGDSKSDSGAQGEANSYLERMSGGSTAPASSSTPSTTANTPGTTFSGQSSSISPPKPSPTEKKELPATSGDFKSFGMPGASTSSPKSSFAPSSKWGANSDSGSQGEANSYLERMAGGNVAPESSATPFVAPADADSSPSWKKPESVSPGSSVSSSRSNMKTGTPSRRSGGAKASKSPPVKWVNDTVISNDLDFRSANELAPSMPFPPAFSLSPKPAPTVSSRDSDVSPPKLKTPSPESPKPLSPFSLEGTNVKTDSSSADKNGSKTYALWTPGKEKQRLVRVEDLAPPPEFNTLGPLNSAPTPPPAPEPGPFFGPVPPVPATETRTQFPSVSPSIGSTATAPAPTPDSKMTFDPVIPGSSRLNTPPRTTDSTGSIRKAPDFAAKASGPASAPTAKAKMTFEPVTPGPASFKAPPREKDSSPPKTTNFAKAAAEESHTEKKPAQPTEAKMTFEPVAPGSESFKAPPGEKDSRTPKTSDFEKTAAEKSRADKKAAQTTQKKMTFEPVTPGPASFKAPPREKDTSPPKTSDFAKSAAEESHTEKKPAQSTSESSSARAKAGKKSEKKPEPKPLASTAPTAKPYFAIPKEAARPYLESPAKTSFVHSSSGWNPGNSDNETPRNGDLDQLLASNADASQPSYPGSSNKQPGSSDKKQLKKTPPEVTSVSNELHTEIVVPPGTRQLYTFSKWAPQQKKEVGLMNKRDKPSIGQPDPIFPSEK